MKKVWEKPMLVVLTRGMPEEAVLTGCKSSSIWLGSMATVDFCTQYPSIANVPCSDCNAYVAS